MENLDASLTQPDPRDALVLAALLRADSPVRVHHKAWHRATLPSDTAAACAYCSKDLTTALPREAMFSYLVPLALGAPSISENRVLACASCAQSRFGTDLVAWPRLSEIPADNCEQLLARRALMLRQAANHLTPHGPRSAPLAILHHLENRFTHPRFRAFAYSTSDRAWIGWRTHKGEQRDKQGPAGLLRWGHGAVPVGNDKTTCFCLPADRFLDAVWDLIEHNGLLIPLKVDGLDAGGFPTDDWRVAWPKTFTRVQDLVRRRSRKHRDLASSPPRKLSDKPAAVSRRRTRKREHVERERLQQTKGRENLWREYEQAFADYQALAKARKSQAVPVIPIGEMRRLSREVLALKCRAMGLTPGEDYEREPA